MPTRPAGLGRARPATERTIPSRLAVRDVGIDVPIRPVGIDDQGRMEIPASAGTAGWYRFGPRPTDRTGTTVLAGHVDTRREGLGPFAALASVRVDSLIVITDRSGREVTYRVSELTRIAKDRADLGEVFDRSGRPRLQLITCAGAYDPRTGYRDYLIVTAMPV